jgi:putative transposase
MPVAKQKRTTSTPDPSTSDPSSPVLPDQQVFHHYLRTLAQSAVRVVLEAVMREELDQFIGATWGECTSKRKGYRNGHYTRDLVTSTGRLEDLQVPRDRAGQFHTQAFERYSRYEPHIARSDSPRCLWPGQARDIRGRSGPNVAGSRLKSAARSVASTRP